jgi:hypothetical protein
MNKIAVSILLTLFVAANALAAGGVADKKGTIHVGVKAGPSNLTNSPIGFGVYGGYTLFGPNTFKNNNFFSKLSFAVEGEYVSLGSVSDYSASTMGVVATATFPINEQFSAIAKAGPASVTHKYPTAYFCGTFTLCTGTASVTTTGVHGGIAGHYNITPKIGVRAGYDFYPDGFSMMSASGVFKF